MLSKNYIVYLQLNIYEYVMNDNRWYKIGCSILLGKNNEIFATVIGLDGNDIIIECDGYMYRKNYSCITKFTKTVTTLTDESYIVYMNNKHFIGTEFEVYRVYRIDGKRKISIINNTNGRTYMCESNYNIDMLRRVTNGNRVNKKRREVL